MNEPRHLRQIALSFASNHVLISIKLCVNLPQKVMCFASKCVTTSLFRCCNLFLLVFIPLLPRSLFLYFPFLNLRFFQMFFDKVCF